MIIHPEDLQALVTAMAVEAVVFLEADLVAAPGVVDHPEDEGVEINWR